MVYIHTAFFIYPSVSVKNAPASYHRNRGGSIALFVLFQSLTQLLAGVLDRGLSGCQNYRAFWNHIYRLIFVSMASYHRT